MTAGQQVSTLAILTPCEFVCKTAWLHGFSHQEKTEERSRREREREKEVKFCLRADRLSANIYLERGRRERLRKGVCRSDQRRFGSKKERGRERGEHCKSLLISQKKSSHTHWCLVLRREKEKGGFPRHQGFGRAVCLCGFLHEQNVCVCLPSTLGAWRLVAT